MKNILLLIFILLGSKSNVYSQVKPNTNDSLINCNSIREGIIDQKLYDKLPSGKLIFRPDLNKYKVYEIRNNENKVYYVTKYLMRKIRRFSIKNKCPKIKIKKLDRTAL